MPCTEHCGYCLSAHSLAEVTRQNCEWHDDEWLSDLRHIFARRLEKKKKTFKSGNHSLEEYAQWRLRLKGCAQIVTYAVVGQKTWEGSVWVSVCRFYWVYFESLTWCSGKCYLFINLKTFYIKTNELVLFFCCNGDARIVPWMWPCFFAIVILSYSFARKCSFQYKNVVNSIKRRNAVKLQSKFVGQNGRNRKNDNVERERKK